MDLNNACVLITGASKGIGASIARAFARHGAHVVLAARSVNEIDQLSKELNGSPLPLDVSDPEQLAGVIDRVESEIAPIDILVNNAGVETEEFVEDIDENRIKAVSYTHLRAHET